MCAILYFFLMVCNKPHANPTIIYENIKEIHILAVGGNLEFPILSHVLLRREFASKHYKQTLTYANRNQKICPFKLYKASTGYWYCFEYSVHYCLFCQLFRYFEPEIKYLSLNLAVNRTEASLFASSTREIE